MTEGPLPDFERTLENVTPQIDRAARSGFDLSDVIECAAELVDGPGEVSEDYRRGVVELATRICLCGDDFDDAVTVMGYAVCGVNKPTLPPEPGPEVTCD